MSDREFPFNPLATCDGCGAVGAWDIYGDLLCDKCLDPNQPSTPIEEIRRKLEPRP